MILFSSTSDRQVQLIKIVFVEFCESFGHKINTSKTRIYFFHNVAANEATRISNEFGFQVSLDLGMYLGVPLLHGIIMKNTYRYILEKVWAKLFG